MLDLSRIAAVALDFDGTLIEHGETIRPAAQAAIARAAAAGVKVCTASGRPPGGQQEILARNGLGPEAGLIAALCCDERSVWLLRDGAYEPYRPWNDAMEAEWRRLLPAATALWSAALEQLRDQGYDVQPHVTGDKIIERGLLDYKFSGEDECRQAAVWLTEFVTTRSAELMVNSNWHLAQILAKAGGKGNSVAAMARALGLAPGEMLAVGDRENDVTMLDGSAGLAAAAVGNAVAPIRDLVRRQGGYLATAEVGAGVAEILDAVVAARGRA